MKKARIAIILGILFGLCLFPVAYVSLVVGVALAIASASWFGYSFYIFIAFGVITIICSCFAKFRPLVTVVGNGLATLFLITMIIYLIGTGLFFESFGFSLVYLIPTILGAVSCGLAARYLYDAGIKPHKEKLNKE